MPFGKIECFDLSSRKWTSYVNRVKQFIALNEIKSELHTATLITLVGQPTYDLMCDLCAPDNPEDKSFDILSNVVQQHLEPRRSDIAERHVFRLRRQMQNEDLSTYLQHLKHLASTCNFGEKLEENLRDQFVSGLASNDMRSRLFAERDVDYRKAVDLALALEAAERHAEASGSGSKAPGATDDAVSTPALHRIGVGGATAYRRRDTRPQHCWRCGRDHTPDKCRYKHFNCDECGVRGHLKVMCKSVRSASDRKPNRLESNKNQFYIDSDSDESEFYKMHVDGSCDEPYVVNILINNIPLKFEVDTGSKISVISEHYYDKYFKDSSLSKCNMRLNSYTGEKIFPLGFLTVTALYDCGAGSAERREASGLRLYVIPSGGPPLLGRAWLRRLGFSTISIHKINEHVYDSRDDITLIRNLEKEFSDVFSPGLGTCTKMFSLKLSDNEPIFHKARSLPLALRGPVQQELERLVNEGTIVKVDHSEYGTPIVPVIKKCGGIRICGDYKVTINSKLKRDPYPLPRIEDLYAALSGAKIFSKIDLAHAFEQVLLCENSRACTTINTHVGTFEYIRTPYGLCCIPEKFQKLMDEVIRGIPMTVVYLDDICVGGHSKSNHISNVREVFRRLQSVGLRIKIEKCQFFKSEVNYLGHVINKDGLHPDMNKVKAISDAPPPGDIHQLKSFLGLVNYYGKFVANMSTILCPLYNLLKRKTPWSWTRECNQAFCEIKRLLSNDNFLAHYRPDLPLVLSVDSSAYGVGAVLAHKYVDGSEKPICCVSRTLNEAEKSYSQLDKEALAIFYGVIKNHQYLLGRRFIIRTDHKPLSYIFGDKAGIPQTAASRLQRYAARLAAYDFSVEWVSSARNAPADCLSRLPLQADSRATKSEPMFYLLYLENEFPISYKNIAEATMNDPILRIIYKNIISGWPDDTEVEQEKPYFYRKENLFVDHGCILFNYRIVIPPKFRAYILRELHEGHLGIVKMKNTARNYVYWPGLDSDIEKLCKDCVTCRQQRDAPPHAPLTPWHFPSRPWQRLHADFAEYQGKHYLIIVDAHSKWIEVFQLNSTNAKMVINKFREIFARFGLPQQMVTDNGPPFTSYDLKNYFDKNGITHTLTSPYRPKGNGAAENAVKTVKKCIKKACYEGVEVEQAVNVMLFHYRNSEHATTGVAPAVALLGRRLRSRLDALRPDVEGRVQTKQALQVERAGGRQRSVSVGDTVYIRDYTKNKDKWIEGQVNSKAGPSSYSIKLPNDTVKRHIDQILESKQASKHRFSLASASTSDSDAKLDGVDVQVSDDHDAVIIDEPPEAVVVDSVSPLKQTYNLRPRNKEINYKL